MEFGVQKGQKARDKIKKHGAFHLGVTLLLSTLTMYIGPWQEFKLAKIIAQQTQYINQIEGRDNPSALPSISSTPNHRNRSSKSSTRSTHEYLRRSSRPESTRSMQGTPELAGFVPLDNPRRIRGGIPRPPKYLPPAAALPRRKKPSVKWEIISLLITHHIYTIVYLLSSNCILLYLI